MHFLISRLLQRLNIETYYPAESSLEIGGKEFDERYEGAFKNGRIAVIVYRASNGNEGFLSVRSAYELFTAYSTVDRERVLCVLSMHSDDMSLLN